MVSNEIKNTANYSYMCNIIYSITLIISGRQAVCGSDTFFAWNGALVLSILARLALIIIARFLHGTYGSICERYGSFLARNDMICFNCVVARFRVWYLIIKYLTNYQV